MKDLLRQRAALGTFCELPCAESVEIAGRAGWDYVIIDCEHGPIDSSMLPGMVRAAETAGCQAVVRVAENNAALIQHALDAGASGIMIPQISSLEAARAAVTAARFHPLGRRGLNPYVRAAAYSAMNAGEFIATANDKTTLILQIESVSGLDQIESILDLDGVDAVFLGPFDLSQSLGIPGQTGDPRIFEAGQQIVKQAAARSKYVGVFVDSDDAAIKWLGAGARFVSFSIDTVQLLRALRAANQRLRES